jgi:hypothetical protein
MAHTKPLLCWANKNQRVAALRQPEDPWLRPDADFLRMPTAPSGHKHAFGYLRTWGLIWVDVLQIERKTRSSSSWTLRIEN